LTGEARKGLHQAKSLPILKDINIYMEREQPNVLPNSPEGIAMSYTLSNWDALVRFAAMATSKLTITVRSAASVAWR
jgi:hypothetical protein